MLLLMYRFTASLVRRSRNRHAIFISMYLIMLLVMQAGTPSSIHCPMRFQNSFCGAVRKVEERARGRRHLLALYNGFHDAAVQLGDDDADDGPRHQEGGVQRQRTGLLAPHARHAYSEEVLQVHEKISVDCFLFGSRINVGGSGGDGSPTAQELRQATAEQADKNSAAHDEMRAAELGHACHSKLRVVERLFQPALAA